MDSEAKYNELKKKYAILQKQYQLIQNDYQKVNEELSEAIQEKRLLQTRINEILGKQNDDS